MPLQATSGAASYDAFGGGAAAVPQYIEEVFSTWLYTGTGSAQTITNGIDFSTKGGLLWLKARDDTRNNWLYDTTRSIANGLRSDSTASATSTPDALTAFNSNGFSIGTSGNINTSGNTLVSWSFEKALKFFDVVTYTGDGTAGLTVNHNLGSVPGCIIVKSTTATNTDWQVYHQSLGANKRMRLNTTDAVSGSFATYWNSTSPTSTQFTLGDGSDGNTNGATYVAYLFAHNAGGFGLTGTDNVISCGSYSGTGSTPNDITLGFEPQWLLVKNTTSSGQEWGMFDNMRGLVTGTDGDAQLFANASSAENVSAYFRATATGFACEDASTRYNASGNTYIYIAIRRGPMKVPTSGTSVFSPLSETPVSGPTTTFTTNFPVDLLISKNRQYESNNLVIDRLRGSFQSVITNGTRAEETGGSGVLFDSNVKAVSTNWGTGFGPIIGWNFRRAPSFFDEVCYTGTGSQQNITHNLGVAPELIFVKSRSAANGGLVYNKTITASKYLKLFFTGEGDRAVSNDTGGFAGVEPTSSVFTVGTYNNVNGSGSTYVAYLFATCAGVSKVGSYTGTGTTLQVDCGFTGGARFVLIKRTDSTGDWYVWDSARGIVSGNDPYSLLNSDVAEVTSTDYVDTYSAGFEISSTAPAAINASGGSFIFLAIS